MPVPKWNEFMIPSLRALSDGKEWRRRDIVKWVADDLGLSEEQRQVLNPSGQEMYANRGNWAVTYLSKANAISSPRRGHWEITDFGRELVEKYPGGMTEMNLREAVGQPDGSSTYLALKLAAGDQDIVEKPEELDPFEQIQVGVERNHASVAGELLVRLHQNEPAFFEQAVLALLMAMGYGGTRGKATRTQLSNDGGIDGVIDQDALGLSRIYVQAKRYAPDTAIGRPDIQGFVGALQGVQANQGVFLTTAKFSQGAQEYADNLQSRVVLIDGERLARLMIRYGVGVQTKQTVEVVEIDEDFFE